MNSAPLSLLHDSWIPVRRASGAKHLMRVSGVVHDLQHDPVVAVDWGRPDLDVATLEFLIALLAVVLRPVSNRAWRRRWEFPPTAEEFQAALDSFALAFVLDGEGPRFLQDAEDFDGDLLPIERLLIDTPGQNTVLKNIDLLVKRGRLGKVSRSAAAIMLYALQAFAPAGGAGHRTSLRGGGPLTTLVVPGSGPVGEPVSLWHQLWANVTVGAPAGSSDLPLIFPWLASTRRSADKGGGTVLDGQAAHPLQAMWGMPRRIRLVFRPALPGEICDLTGLSDAVMVVGFRTLPYGVQYLNAVTEHPLTPLYFAKEGEAPLAVHPQPGGIGYRHWHSLTVEDGMRSRPAAAVSQFMNLHDPDDSSPAWPDARLAIYGYDMDNAKARSFVEVTMPLFAADAPPVRKALLAHARRLSEGATQAANLLRAQVRAAVAEEAKVDATALSAVRQRFFAATDASFWNALHRAREAFNSDLGADPEPLTKSWLGALRACAFEVFDEVAPLDPLSPGAAGRMVDGKWAAPPVVAARRNLGVALSGYGKWGDGLFNALGLPGPQPAKRKSKAKAKAS